MENVDVLAPFESNAGYKFFSLSEEVEVTADLYVLDIDPVDKVGTFGIPMADGATETKIQLLEKHMLIAVKTLWPVWYDGAGCFDGVMQGLCQRTKDAHSSSQLRLDISPVCDTVQQIRSVYALRNFYPARLNLRILGLWVRGKECGLEVHVSSLDDEHEDLAVGRQG
jgi:hypothetical protein